MSAGAETPLWTVDLPRLWRAVRARRGWLLKVNAVAAVLAVGVVLLLPRWYAASVTMVPAPGSGAWLDLSGTGVGLGSMSVSLGPQPTPQDQLRMVVQSRALADSLIQSFGLRQRWRVKRMDQARDKLADCTSINTPKEGQVEVKVEARTPQLAMDLASAYARYASLESVRLKTSLASERRHYLEAQLRNVERDIALAGERVRAFEELHGAISLPDQTKASLDANTVLQTEIAQLETELAATRRYFTESSTPVLSLVDRIDELKRQMRLLQGGGQALMPATSSLPAIKQQYLELTREQTSLIAVSELLRRFYEQARVEEANPVPEFSVLDAPELPEHAARPPRALTVVLSVALAIAASVTYVYLREDRATPAAAPALSEAA